MESLPLTVCPSQLQLQSTDNQSLAAIEAKLFQSFFDEGFITDMSSLDTCPFPTIIPDPAPPSPSPSSEVAPASEDPQLDEDFFADLTSSSTGPPPPFSFDDDLPVDYSAALLESWDAAAAAVTANEHQPALPAAATSTTNYEAVSCAGTVPVPVAVGQAPVTPESSTRRSSDDVLGEGAPCGWGWDAVSAPVPGARPGYMTPPGSAGMAMAMTMETAMAMDVEEIDWEALLALCTPAAPPPPPAAQLAAPIFFPTPAPAPAPTPTLISPPLNSTTTTTAPALTKPAKTKAKAQAQASERRERKVTRRRRDATKAAAPGTFVFAENIVPPPEVYVSAYTHTREYCLDARGKLLKRRRYEDGK